MKFKDMLRSLIPALLMGGCLGAIIGVNADRFAAVLPYLGPNADSSILLGSLKLFAFIFVAFYIQIILHEGGHLIFGLLTGYSFSSFRIGSFMLVKNNEGWSVKRMRIAGTGGQCLLNPPETDENGYYPTFLYNMGGVIMNILTGILFYLLFLRCESPGLSLLLLMTSLLGFYFAMTNGIPINTTVANDGFNARELRRNPAARETFRKIMLINQNQTQGIRLKDMPAELFRLPENSDMHNTMVSSLAVFAHARSTDKRDFDLARQQADFLLSSHCTILKYYEAGVRLELCFLDLLEKGAAADASLLTDKKYRAIAALLKNSPSYPRLEYAAAVLKDKDEQKKELALKKFRRMAEKYPFPGERRSEEELIDLVDQKAAEIS